MIIWKMTSMKTVMFVCSKVMEEIFEYFPVITVAGLYRLLGLKKLNYPGYVFPGLF